MLGKKMNTKYSIETEKFIDPVRAFFAGGNGGQIVMGIPELDLVIAFYGGNYNDASALNPQRVYVPQYILSAVDK